MLLQAAPGAASPAAAVAAALAVPAAVPPVLLGRLQLSWQEWLRSHSSDERLPSPQPPPQLSRALAVSTQQLDLSCLHSIAQQQLGCTAAAADMDADGGSSGSMQRQSYVLPAAPAWQQGSNGLAAAASAATVHITLHGSRLAEVQLQASTTAMLAVLQQQLEVCVQAAAAAAGAPAGDATVAPSLLAPHQAEAAAAAAGALVQELDASIEWVEALLREKLALGSAERRQRAAPDPSTVRRTQAAALVAAAGTDACLLHLLDQS